MKDRCKILTNCIITIHVIHLYYHYCLPIKNQMKFSQDKKFVIKFVRKCYTFKLYYLPRNIDRNDR